MTEVYYNVYLDGKCVCEIEVDTVDEATKYAQEWWEELRALSYEREEDATDEVDIVEFNANTGERTNYAYRLMVEYTYEPSDYEQHNTYRGGI